MNTTDSDAPAKNDWSDWRQNVQGTLADVAAKKRVELEARDDGIVLSAECTGTLDAVSAMHKGLALSVLLFPLLPTAFWAYLAAFGDLNRPGLAWGCSLACLAIFGGYAWWALDRVSHNQYEFVFEPERVRVRYTSKTEEVGVSIEAGDDVEVLSKNSTGLAVGSELIPITLPFDRDDAHELAKAIQSHVGPADKRAVEDTDAAARVETGEWSAQLHHVDIDPNRIRVSPRPLRETAYGWLILAGGWGGILFFGVATTVSLIGGLIWVAAIFSGFVVLSLASLLWYGGRSVTMEADFSARRIAKTTAWFFGRETVRHIDVGSEDRLRLSTPWTDPEACALALEDADTSEKLIVDRDYPIVRVLALNLAKAFDLEFVDEQVDDGT